MNKYIATFGAGQVGEGWYISILANSYADAVNYMENTYVAYCMVYPEDQWLGWVAHATKIGVPVEKKLKEIIVLDL